MSKVAASKNDITYLSNVRLNAAQSLPFLRTSPIQAYVDERLRAGEAEKEGSGKLLRLGLRKFSKLNQKKEVQRMFGREEASARSASDEKSSGANAYMVSSKALPVIQDYERVLKNPHIKEMISVKLRISKSLAKLKPLHTGYK